MVNQYRYFIAMITTFVLVNFVAAEEVQNMGALENQFRQLPMEARRLTGPLFWLHGDESKERLEMYVEKVAQGGNGCFTAESRPHNDWLGPGWFRDLGICLEAAKKNNLKMWIFDERWWPSGEVGGKVPQKYASKYMQTKLIDVTGPKRIVQEIATDKLITVLAGRVSGEGIEGASLIDLTNQLKNNQLTWNKPSGRWKVMIFTWGYAKWRNNRYLVDGVSRDAVDWYIQTVYQPHYDRFAQEYGKTIKGYFYDEPETPGDWGTEVIPMLKERGIDWKKALVAWKFKLAGEEQIAAKYQYQDALAETWGRLLFGGIETWCRDHKVTSIGHFLEHRQEYLHPRLCAGNMFQLQKYSDMGAIDAVFKQFVPGRKDNTLYQTPKIGSSISHVYGKKDDLSMVEIFGARGQDLSYPEMKWWTDRMQVCGINFHIPHSFNPRSPFDRDCPPYFYDSGYEPRWPLYRVYANYTARLSLMLHGGHHVCPVAFLFLGNSYHVGKSVLPEQMTTALQDALFDCDWLPYDVFEDKVTIAKQQLHLYQERYKILIVPAAEVIPYGTLAKAKAFYDAGGVVIGYGMLPTQSATPGKTSKEIAQLRHGIWGANPDSGLKLCQSNSAGGRSYFLPAEPTPEQIQQVLTADAGIHPTLEVLSGETDHWLHVLHRVKLDRDVFLICNMQHEGKTKEFRLRAHAQGVPECWDAMRNEITSLSFERIDNQTVDFSLRLEPLESVLIVFQPQAIERPLRPRPDDASGKKMLMVKREKYSVPELKIPEREETKPILPLKECHWVWYNEGEPRSAAPVGTRYFRKQIIIPSGVQIDEAYFRLTADNGFVLYVNGREVARGDNWMTTQLIDMKQHLKDGTNVLAVAAMNTSSNPNPAGLIGRYQIALNNGRIIEGRIDRTWKVNKNLLKDWTRANVNDSSWLAAKEIGAFGIDPWGQLDGAKALTLAPVKADPFKGSFQLPADWLEKRTIYLEAAEIKPEGAATVKLNDHFIGGFIGKPYRLNLTEYVRKGENTLLIEPFAPKSVRIVTYPNMN